MVSNEHETNKFPNKTFNFQITLQLMPISYTYMHNQMLWVPKKVKIKSNEKKKKKKQTF